MAHSKLRFQLACVWALCLMRFNYCKVEKGCIVAMNPTEVAGYFAMALLAKSDSFIQECSEYLYIHDSYSEAETILRPIFDESPKKVNLHIGSEVNDILKALKSATSARILILGSYQHVAQAFEKFGHEAVGTVVTEIFLASWDNVLVFSEKQSISPMPTYNEHVASILQISSLNGKYRIVDVRTDRKCTSMISNTKSLDVIDHFLKSENVALKPLLNMKYVPYEHNGGTDWRSISPFEKYMKRQLRTSVIAAALAMSSPQVFEWSKSEYKYNCNGKGETQSIEAIVITEILHEQFRGLLLYLIKKWT